MTITNSTLVCFGCDKEIKCGDYLWSVNKQREKIQDGIIDVYYAEAILQYCESCALKRNIGKLFISKKGQVKQHIITSIFEENSENYCSCIDCEKTIHEQEIYWDITYEKVFETEQRYMQVEQAYSLCSFCEVCYPKWDFDRIKISSL